MVPIAQLIREQHAEIMRRWSARAAKAASAKGLSAPTLQNVMSRFLDALGDAGPAAETRQRRLLDSHLASRLRQGFVIPEIVEEVVAVGSCIAELCAELPEAQSSDLGQLVPVLERLQRAEVWATESFWLYLREDEQVEKALLRRLQAIATTARRDPQASGDFTAHLGEALAIVVEGVPSRWLSIALGDGALSVAASAGEAPEPCGGPPTPELHPLLDATATGGHGSAIERTLGQGAHAVAVRLPEHGDLVGVLYAVRRSGPFGAREVRRLEAAGALLATLLENSRLYTALRLRIEEAEAEKRLRETFVSVLAHDLRGPLTAARLAAGVLARSIGDPVTRDGLTRRIVSGIDRADRMVTDLLDANRVRAGQPLAVKAAPCDLAAIAREVASELEAEHGPRFVVGGDASVEGVWSADHLRRIVTNLASNAVKYGAAATPIALDVRRTDAGAELSVHNSGNPIPPEEIPRLFQAFSRAGREERPGVAGWGLGLALVKGSAEAHGGSVRVESSPQGGTTFTVSLPRDARPLQAVPSRS